MNSLLKRMVASFTIAFAAVGIAQAETPNEIRLDYAYYSPPSLVLKRFGWLEQDLKAENIPVKWVFSAGSNRSLEYLNSGSVDFGSTAGLAAVLSKANGNPIKGVYVYSRPEWTALVVSKDSPIKSVKDLAAAIKADPAKVTWAGGSAGGNGLGGSPWGLGGSGFGGGNRVTTTGGLGFWIGAGVCASQPRPCQARPCSRTETTTTPSQRERWLGLAQVRPDSSDR